MEKLAPKPLNVTTGSYNLNLVIHQAKSVVLSVLNDYSIIKFSPPEHRESLIIAQ